MAVPSAAGGRDARDCDEHPQRNTPLYALTAAAVLASTKLATHDHLAANGLQVVDGKVEIIPPPDEDEDDAPTEFELPEDGKSMAASPLLRTHECSALEENESKE